MGKNIAKLVYKPDTQSTDEFIIIINPDEVCHTLRFTRANLNHLVPYSTRNTKLEVSFLPNLAWFA